MVAKGHQNSTDSPNTKVIGEIDTSAPIQSVKDAVSLFGEGTFSGEKPSIKRPKAHSTERVLAKETQLHLVQKELNKLKEKLQNAETTKVQALAELDKAKVTVEGLTSKLKCLYKSKELAIMETETAMQKAKELEDANSADTSVTNGAWEKRDLEAERAQYMIVINELDAAKQEFQKFRRDCAAALEAKRTACKQEADANDAAKTNEDRVGELFQEISAVRESIGLVKLATLQAQQEQASIFSNKDVLRQSYKATLEESLKRLLAMKQGFNPELPRSLEAQLTETLYAIEALQKQLENAKASDLDSVRTVTLEHDGAKESLQKVAEEESSLRSLVEALKVELESVQKEHLALKEREAETESIAGNFHVKLCQSKAELEVCLAEECKARVASDEMITTLNQLSLETENARREAEEMKSKAEEMKEEAETASNTLKEAEEKLRVALEESEEAKTTEERALNQIKVLSQQTSAARASTSESDAKITMSREEFQSLSRKVDESGTLAEMKVAAAMAQVEAVKASQNEALKRLEATQEEIEDMKVATEEALKRAGMAEAAERAVEGELRKWREKEQKKAAEAASRILAESEMSSELSLRHYRVQRQNPPIKVVETMKMEKQKVSLSKKALVSNLSGILTRKKNQIEGGSPFLPGDKPL